jgi:hypothetical protein
MVLDTGDDRPRQDRPRDPETFHAIVGLDFDEYEHAALDRLPDAG